MLLCIVLALIAGGAAFWMIRPLMGPAPAPAEGEPERRIAGYQAALAALEEDRVTRMIGAAEAGAERVLLARALLAEAPPPPPVARPLKRRVAFALAAVMPLLGILVYFMTGSNAGTPSFVAYSENAKLQSLTEDLAARVRANPSDPEGHRLMGLAQAALGHYDASAREFGQALALGARSPELLTAYGEMLGLDGQRASAEAVKAFDEALNHAPRDVRARIDRAEARFALGDFAGAREDWIVLREAAPPGGAAAAALDRRIAGAERSMKGAAIASESPDAQGAMIQGMVDGLAARLAANPGDLPGWQRLIHSYVVLGEREKGRAALAQARQAFAQDAPARATLDDAARELGADGP